MDAESETLAASTSQGRQAGFLASLLPALQRLDALLDHAVKAADALFGPEAAKDAYRGLYISAEDAERLLQRQPGEPSLWHGEDFVQSDPTGIGAQESRLSWLTDVYGLSPFDVDVVLLALAPELDLRYGKLYAYLQDDVTRKRPSVDLALNLLCATADEKLERRVHFAPDAPLVRDRLLQLYVDPQQHQPSLLSQVFRLDDQVVRLLLGQESLDPRLAHFCSQTWPVGVDAALPLPDEQMHSVKTRVLQAWGTQAPLKLYLRGPAGAGQRQIALTLADTVGAPLLIADLARIGIEDFRSRLEVVFREAWFQGAMLYFDNISAVQHGDREVEFRELQRLLAKDPGVTLLSGDEDWRSASDVATGVWTIPVDYPDSDHRQRIWRDQLNRAGIDVPDDELAVLAARFRLLPAQIADAVSQAHQQTEWRVDVSASGKAQASNEFTILPDLFAAARDQCGHTLSATTRKIRPVYTWTDIVLPQDTLAQLHELSQQVAHRGRVLGAWGFGRKLSQGKGVSVLFAGPSGTGKTMAAEVIANDLGLDLYGIDLASVISKYIGETEKNLDRIFTAAENANAILFFDEADALFGKRSEVRDSHDRYANIEISYLLQKMESYEGLAILATNLRQNLDESFIRRLSFTVHFPLPDVDQRRLIWQGIWPPETPLADDVDLLWLADRFKLTGGNIKNIALAAAFLAAADGASIGTNHLLKAARREYQKLGKHLSDAELAVSGDVLRAGQGMGG